MFSLSNDFIPEQIVNIVFHFFMFSWSNNSSEKIVNIDLHFLMFSWSNNSSGTIFQYSLIFINLSWSNNLSRTDCQYRLTFLYVFVIKSFPPRTDCQRGHIIHLNKLSPKKVLHFLMFSWSNNSS
jgi:hypothetical protein